jgi:autoinducer 2-degrading protein
MFVTLVNVSVKEENVDDFIAVTRTNHECSVKEEGNLRFDILQSPVDPTKFVLYEAYLTQQNAAAHKETQHYLDWRETVADWMAEPRIGTVFNGLYP